MQHFNETSLGSTWPEKIENWLASGLSMARWCRDNQVPYSQFVYQKTKAMGRSIPTEDRPKQFVELTDSAQRPGVIVECQGLLIHLEQGFDETVLLRCLEVVRLAKL